MPGKIIVNERLIYKLYSSHRKTELILKVFDISGPTFKRIINRQGKHNGAKYHLNENAFSAQTPESCYWAGFLAADGWIGERRKKKFRLEIKYTDRQHLRKLCHFLGRENTCIRDQRRFKYGKNTYSSIVEVGNSKLVDDLVSVFQVTQCKSFTIKPPLMTSENAKHYMRGYFDGDGCLDKNGLITIVSGSKDMVNWMSEFVATEAGIVGRVGKGDSVYTLCFNKSKSLAVCDWMYSGSKELTRLTRKYERYVVNKQHRRKR
jgi:hypothetical protein